MFMNFQNFSKKLKKKSSKVKRTYRNDIGLANVLGQDIYTIFSDFIIKKSYNNSRVKENNFLVKKIYNKSSIEVYFNFSIREMYRRIQIFFRFFNGNTE